MSLDPATIRRIARLARIGIEDDEVARLQSQLGSILGWVEQLNDLDLDGVAPISGVGHASLRLREDVVVDGDQVDVVLSNAPERHGPFFSVPKVVE
jgi:aspartyl-tRNA(Asn)/glutamyl-tRNA(Gln) amidotransferase subunit C